ncbi:MAG TPA: antitoxin family protein [Pirellulales bacterium]|nr:antitoxin family protein [Pirellulales bacterium]
MQMLTIEATYENGMLKPDQPLPLNEHQRVQVSIHAAVDPVLASAGMFGWTGDTETLERIALDAEFGIRESP